MNKLHVLGLREIVSDVGADRGIEAVHRSVSANTPSS